MNRLALHHAKGILKKGKIYTLEFLKGKVHKKVKADEIPYEAVEEASKHAWNLMVKKHVKGVYDFKITKRLNGIYAGMKAFWGKDGN